MRVGDDDACLLHDAGTISLLGHFWVTSMMYTLHNLKLGWTKSYLVMAGAVKTAPHQFRLHLTAPTLHDCPACG
jgi:hypothetical protein